MPQTVTEACGMQHGIVEDDDIQGLYRHRLGVLYGLSRLDAWVSVLLAVYISG
jgi:hypothetical protein